MSITKPIFPLQSLRKISSCNETNFGLLASWITLLEWILRTRFTAMVLSKYLDTYAALWICFRDTIWQSEA